MQVVMSRSLQTKRLSDDVCADIEATLRGDARLAETWQDFYADALASVEDGRRLVRLTVPLTKSGWTRSDATALATYLHNRASAILTRERHLALGFTHATWTYSGAPCCRKKAVDDEVRLDAAHRQADGKQFLIAEGLEIEGVRTWPGMQRFCRCFSKPVTLGPSP